MLYSLAKLGLLLAVSTLAMAAPAQADVPLPAQDVPPPPALVATGATNAEPRPAMWLLSDEDTKIYLFGTVHILPPGFKWRSGALNKAVAEADELVVETYDPPGSDETEGFEELMLLKQPVPILDRVPKDKRSALAAAIAESEIPVDGFDMLPTWVSAFVLGIEQILGGLGVDDPDDAPGVEDALEEDFRKAGKPIGSVEKAEDVLRAMNALPQEVQVELLLQALADAKEYDKQQSLDEDRLWASGQIDGLLLEALEEIPPAIFDVLITRRNAAWAEWLHKRLERPGTVLFAVGTGHLVGRQSLQVMLARKGLTAHRFQ